MLDKMKINSTIRLIAVFIVISSVALFTGCSSSAVNSEQESYNIPIKCVNSADDIEESSQRNMLSIVNEKISFLPEDTPPSVTLEAETYLKSADTLLSSCEYDLSQEALNKADALVSSYLYQEEPVAPIEENDVLVELTPLAGESNTVLAPVEPEVEAEPIEVAPIVAPTYFSYEVLKGDSLWGISDKTLEDPYLWPIIYWENTEQIKDPDLIFPGQSFQINSQSEASEKEEAIDFSKARKGWSLYDNK